jgi:hypothetical protein
MIDSLGMPFQTYDSAMAGVMAHWHRQREEHGFRVAAAATLGFNLALYASASAEPVKRLAHGTVAETAVNRISAWSHVRLGGCGKNGFSPNEMPLVL